MHVLIAMLSELPVADAAAPGVDLDAALRDYEDVLGTHGAGAGMLHWLVVAWTRLHGFVGLEIGGNFASLQIDAAALFDREIEVLADQAGLG